MEQEINRLISELDQANDVTELEAKEDKVADVTSSAFMEGKITFDTVKDVTVHVNAKDQRFRNTLGSTEKEIQFGRKK